jgi:phosphohistidine phosphatase
MKLLVIRHGRAGSAEEFAKTGADDELRPLTADGVERMRLGAAGLHQLVKTIDVLATSPLVRARQTADIVAAEFGGPALVELEELRPGSALPPFAEWMQDAGAQETVAIVGHDMHLSHLVSWLMTGRERPLVQIRKGAAVMLALREHGKRRRGPRGATLLWALTPKQLRALSG